MDPIAMARQIVAERYPAASAAVLGGGAAAGRATASSDFDIVVLVGGPPAPFRETFEHRGRPVEVFCHSAESFEVFADRETDAGRSPLLHMCAEGAPLLDRDGLGQRVREDARRRLAAGPRPLSPQEVEDQRYAITDLLDDLDGATDPDDLLFTANRLLPLVAEHVLAARGRWRSHGKWLARRLRAADPDLCAALVGGYRHVVRTGDPAPFAAAVTAALSTTGGRVFAGYRREARLDGLSLTPSPR